MDRPGSRGCGVCAVHHADWDTSGRCRTVTPTSRTSTSCARRWLSRAAARCKKLLPIVDRYVEQTPDNEPERLHADSLSETRSGPVGLLRDLQDVHMLATDVRGVDVDAGGSGWVSA